LLYTVSDNFDERIEQIQTEIVVDNDAVARETKAYKQIPDITQFTDENGVDTMQQQIEQNYNQIKLDVKQIVVEELKRIADDPELQHLIKKE
jgi:Tfp pilus assembly pilus retraction ATPase PilT